MSDMIQTLTAELVPAVSHPNFKSGDNVTVYYKIREGGKERIQMFRGNVIQISGGENNPNRTFTVRKVSDGIGVERVFPLNSPSIDKIEVNKFGKVRRARLFYLREQFGKSARIKERRIAKHAN
ncbi:MAG: 50S ribosomal protein L19 [Sphingobacteriales bacterium]|nr:50S ribosomal protein L19 [Sphingobacteriales bacterium]